MQQVNLLLFRNMLALAGAVASLGLTPQCIMAQSTPTPALDDPTGSLTTLLFAQIRPANTPLKRNDPGAVVKENLREALEQGGHFHVVTVSLTQPIIRKNVEDHTLSPADLTEPYKTESLQKIARVMGTRYILTFETTLDKSGMKTEIHFLESVGATEWRTVLSNQFETPTSVGKRRLKPEEMALLNVDTIAASLNIPSHLSDSLHLEIKTRTIPAPQPDKGQVAAKGNEKPNPPDRPVAGNTGQTADPQTNSGKTEDGTGIATVPLTGGPSGANPGRASPPTGKPAPSPLPPDKSTAKTTRPQHNVPPHGSGNGKPAQPLHADPINGVNTPPIFSGNVAAQGAEEPDYEALAQRYRQIGDLANVITALRHAVDGKPRDLNLRRALIQAYQERQLTDAALAEIGRALTLAPNDSSLYQLSGDALYAKGEIASAVRAYREAVRINPANTAAQVALGDALLTDAQTSEAMSAYQVAVNNDPKNPLPHRRLARALASRAVSDPALYAASIEEIKKARSLSTSSETQAYLSDYVALMHLMESRFNDLLDELEGTYTAFRQGKRTPVEANRAASDMKMRVTAASDYLDNVPPAIGQDVTHAQYQQGAATVLEAVSYFRAYLGTDNNAGLDEKLRIARIDARHALSAAGKRLPANTPTHAMENPGTP